MTANSESSAALRLEEVNANIREAEAFANRPENSVKLIAVTKTFDANAITPLLNAGQRIFGENRVQEAKQKWPDLKSVFNDVELHLIGPLQSNKTAEAVALFDAIHTVDREKIARAIKQEIDKQNRKLKLFIQVNTGEEPQKAGIAPQDADDFIAFCRNEVDLPIEGLMCIPPADEAPGPHFALLEKIATRNGIAELSMGMSGDYKIATQQGATFVRVGSALFGSRSYAQLESQ